MKSTLNVAQVCSRGGRRRQSRQAVENNPVEKRPMVGKGPELGWRVRCICGGSKGNTIFTLGNEDFNWFGWVIVRLHLDVVRDEVRRAETTIGA